MSIYTKPKYCVYLTTYLGNKLPPFYIGSTNIKSINEGYHGSVKSKKYKHIWDSELKNNPHLFKTKIIKLCHSRKFALYREKCLQKLLNVVKSEMYINESLASKNGMFGRDVSRQNHPLWNKGHSDNARINISKSHADFSGSNNPRARKIKIITNTGEVFICDGNLKQICASLNIPWQTVHQRLLKGFVPKSGKCVNYSAEYVE
jgi:hypothetical protein